MPPSITYTRAPVADYQKAIIDDPARFTITEAATKTGKTTSHIFWLLEQALKCERNQAVWWVAPVFGQSEVAFKRMKNQITDRNFFKANESKLLLTLPTGAEIYFKSAERPDNLYGDDVYAAVFDEFTRAREEAWHALRTTLTATRGKCKFIGNVRGRSNWGYKMAQLAKQGDDPAYSYHKITAYQAAEAGYIMFEEIAQAKKDMPESVWKELYLAEASEDGSNPFGFKFIELCAVGMSDLPPVCFGIDLAKIRDFTVIIGLDMFGQVCHFQRFQKDWEQTVQTIKLLPNVPMKIDSTGVGDPIVEKVQQGRGNVTGFKFTQASKQQIMEGLALGIQHRKVIIPKSAGLKIAYNDPGNIKNEMENFEFEYTLYGIKYSTPEGIHDDCVCALALAWDLHKNAVHSGQYSWA